MTWEPTPARISGDGSRAHWVRRRTTTRRACRRMMEAARMMAWNDADDIASEDTP